MTTRRESTGTLLASSEPATDLDASTSEHLLRVGGSAAPDPLARLRIRERDLVICDGAGIVHYALQVTSTTAGWTQRAFAFPPLPIHRALFENSDWSRRARRLCSGSIDARSCRVPVGVVAAEIRALGERAILRDGEETVYWLSEAAAAVLQSSGKQAAKAGRTLMADVERARRPSHVALYRLQRAFAIEVALGRSVAALCSRSPRFSDSSEEHKVTSLLCRRLGVVGTLDDRKRRRFSRVAAADTAELLCEALDMAPEQVGL